MGDNNSKLHGMYFIFYAILLLTGGKYRQVV